jgi:hypothetical protein
MSKTITLADGKYTIVYDEDNLFPVKCLRYGEEWRDVTGDNLIFYLCAMIEELTEAKPQQNKPSKETYNYEHFYSSSNDLSSHYR